MRQLIRNALLKLATLALPPMVVILVCSNVGAQRLNDVLSDRSMLSIRDYTARISVSGGGKTSIATIKRNGRTVAKSINRNGPFLAGSRPTRIGLVSLLGRETVPLIVQQYSGGAHCCLSWRIYDLYPEFRMIFDSDRYPIGDAMEDAELIDLDHDGQLEFAHQSNQFAYFDDACFTCLLLPDVVFRFERRSQRYLPANHIFKKYALRQAPFDLERLRSFEANPAVYWAYSLDVVLRYIYAGMEKRAWVFFAKT